MSNQEESMFYDEFTIENYRGFTEKQALKTCHTKRRQARFGHYLYCRRE